MKFLVKKDRILSGIKYAKAGDFVWPAKGSDWGLSRADERATGLAHMSVSRDPDGSWPAFTIPVEDLTRVLEPEDYEKPAEPKIDWEARALKAEKTIEDILAKFEECVTWDKENLEALLAETSYDSTKYDMSAQDYWRDRVALSKMNYAWIEKRINGTSE